MAAEEKQVVGARLVRWFIRTVLLFILVPTVIVGGILFAISFQSDTDLELWTAPSTTAEQSVRWWAVVEKTESGVPWRDHPLAECTPVVVVVKVQYDYDSSPGFGSYGCINDDGQYRYHFQESGAQDPHTEIHGKGDNDSITLNGRLFSLTHGRLFIVNAATGKIDQVDWTSQAGSKPELNAALGDFLQSRVDIPKPSTED